MPPLIVACVRTGDKYSFPYVERLRRMVADHLPASHRFTVLTDRPSAASAAGMSVVEVPEGLPGWWAKMALFQPDWRRGHRVIYLDLDTVVVGDLSPLAAVETELAVCANFTRAAGSPTWPCHYGSCCMVINDPDTGLGSVDLGGSIWRWFHEDGVAHHMEKAGRYGDQMAIQNIVGGGLPLLQDLLPAGFFLNKRDLPQHRDAAPSAASVVVFGGSVRPDNCAVKWIEEAWYGHT